MLQDRGGETWDATAGRWILNVLSVESNKPEKKVPKWSEIWVFTHADPKSQWQLQLLYEQHQMAIGEDTHLI
jgi:hypothetical protein